MIEKFRDEYRWLSNFAPVKITLDGYEYSSIEHAYMSAKSNSKDWKKFCSDANNTPGQVKRKSKGIKLPVNWDVEKFVVMEKCLLQKFTQEPYRQKLLATGSQFIQEGNTWGDKVWGVCLKTGEGDNRLGELIMDIREKLKNGEI